MRNTETSIVQAKAVRKDQCDSSTATPILDRIRPLPRRIARDQILPGLIGAIWLGVIPSMVTSRSGWEQLSQGQSVVAILVGYIMMWFVGIAIHECGHLAAGRLTGRTLESIRVGPLKLHSSFQVTWHWREAWNGEVWMKPRKDALVRWEMIVFAVGGPAANLVSVALSVTLMPMGAQGALTQAFELTGLILGVTNLLPLRFREKYSDGLKIWTQLINRRRAEQWNAIYQLTNALKTTDPENLPLDLLDKATAYKEHSRETIFAHSLAYIACYLAGKTTKMEEHLEACLAHSGRASAAMRDGLITDAAIFQARRRRRIDSAQQWLRELSRKPETPEIRWRIEAALLEAQGDVEGAILKIDQIQKALEKYSDPRTREIALKIVRRWREELCSSRPPAVSV